MIDVSEVINDPDFQQTWKVYRSAGGQWIDGVWTEGAPEILDMSGVVTPTTSKDMLMVPEGDRITESKTFHSTEKIYTTRSDGETGTSDRFEYKGEIFRVAQVTDHLDYGYNKAIALRIAGV